MMARQITVFRHQLPRVFEEWKRQYEEKPEEFGEVGDPGYGKAAAARFEEILREIQAEDKG